MLCHSGSCGAVVCSHLSGRQQKLTPLCVFLVGSSLSPFHRLIGMPSCCIALHCIDGSALVTKGFCN